MRGGLHGRPAPLRAACSGALQARPALCQHGSAQLARMLLGWGYPLSWARERSSRAPDFTFQGSRFPAENRG